MTYYAEDDPFWGAEPAFNPTAGFWANATGGTAAIYDVPSVVITAKSLTGPGVLVIHSFAAYGVPGRLHLDGVDLGLVLGEPSPVFDGPAHLHSVEIPAGDHLLRIDRLADDLLDGNAGFYAFDGGDWTPSAVEPPPDVPTSPFDRGEPKAGATQMN